MDLQHCKVSIIIPVYNVEKYLTECLDSAINQSHLEKEIIIIDDGSTDGTAEIIIDGASYLLQSGDSIVMPANIPHALKAVEKFKMVLTMIR